MKRLLAVAALGALALTSCASPGAEAKTKPPAKHLLTTLSLGDLDAIQDAAAYAAWCGGYLEIWSDKDFIVADCDR